MDLNSQTKNLEMKVMKLILKCAIVIYLGWMTAALQAGDRPAILAVAGPKPGDKYSSTASVAFNGRVIPAVRTQVEIQMLHRLDDERFIPMGGVTIRTQEDGQFLGTLIPGSPGWKGGKTILRMRLESMRQVQSEVEFEIVPREDVTESSWIIRRPKSSGVEIDIDQPKKLYRVGPGELFLIKGTFGSAILGEDTPPVFAELRKEMDGRTLIGQTWYGPSIREEKQLFSYEIEMQAPGLETEFDLVVVPMRTSPKQFFEDRRLAIPVTKVRIQSKAKSAESDK